MKYYSSSLIFLSKSTLRHIFAKNSKNDPNQTVGEGAFDGQQANFYYYKDHADMNKSRKKSKKKRKKARKISAALVSVAIALFVSCLIMECVLLVKYRINIDLNLKATLISRFLYCFAFVGMAVGFLLRSRHGSSEKKKTESGQVDKDFILSETKGASSKKKKIPALGEIDKDFVISGGHRVIPERDKKTSAGKADNDYIF